MPDLFYVAEEDVSLMNKVKVLSLYYIIVLMKKYGVDSDG